MDYSKFSSWVWRGNNINLLEGCTADVFAIPFPEYQTCTKKDLSKACSSSFGLYGDRYRVFAPYYAQDTSLTVKEDGFIETAYNDIKIAFRYYLDNYNSNRPFFIFAHSEAALFGKMLVNEFYNEISARMVCAYLIGWGFPKSDLDTYTNIQPAQTYNDLGTVVAYNIEWDNSEDEKYCTQGYTNFCPEGIEQVAINPITWTTETTESTSNDYLGYGWTCDMRPARYLEDTVITAKLDNTRKVVLIKIVEDATRKEGSEYFKGLCDKCSTKGDLHYLTYSMVYYNLIKNFDDRLQNWLSSEGK